MEKELTAYRITTKWANDLANEVVRVSRGRGGPNARIETEEDWKVVEDIVGVYAKYFPYEIQEYLKLNKLVRAQQATSQGYLQDSNSKKGGEIGLRQTGTWPFELEILWRVVWPNQKFDKKFARKFFTRMRAFSTAEKI